MALLINTNIASLESQRSLSSSANSVDTSTQRLSSGKRVNSAKDDAAALVIAEGLASQIFGSNQAIRNANDAVSLSQTADGALATTSDALQRIRELAVQASNATLSPNDRVAIQAEVNQLTSGINQTAQTTSFNGQNILDGNLGSLDFQVGPNAGDTISLKGANLLTSAYGNNQLANTGGGVNANNSNVQAGATITVAGQSGSQSYTTSATDTAQSVAQEVNRLTPETGVTATAQTNVNLTLGAESYSFAITSSNTAPATVSFTVGGTASTASDFAAGVSAINAQSANTGITAEYDAQNNGIRLKNVMGNNITVVNGDRTAGVLEVTSYAQDGELEAGAVSAAAASAVVVANGNVTFNSPNSFSVTDSGSGLNVATPVPQASTLQPVASVDVSTIENAQSAIEIVDSALATVNEQRGQFGALQSRFDATINNLQVTSENTSAARSRIQDSDFASETATLSRALILQQTGTALLAQANQFPERVLALLQ